MQVVRTEMVQLPRRFLVTNPASLAAQIPGLSWGCSFGQRVYPGVNLTGEKPSRLSEGDFRTDPPSAMSQS